MIKSYWFSLFAPMIIFLAVGLLWPYAALSESSVPVGQCRAFFNNGGYLFDDFEQSNYVNGFLNLHLKLKNQYNDGRGWFDQIFLHKPDCTATIFKTASGYADPMPPKMQFFSIRFNSPTHYDLWNDETDIKIDCLFCSGDLPVGQYATISYSTQRDGNATFMHTGSYSITEVPKNVRNPLIIVPGLMGSKLNFENENVWLNVLKLIAEPDDSFLDILAFNSQGVVVSSKIVAGPIILKTSFLFGDIDYAGLLVSDLEKDGYVENTDMFIFNYDWRFDVRDTALSLKTKIDSVVTQTGMNKVDIVGHSLGGLVIKQYIKDNSAASPLEKIIFVGVPNLGSADAAKALIFGDNFDVPLLNSDEIFKITQNMPSAYQLLPSKEYFNSIQGFYDDFTNTQSKVLNYQQSRALFQKLNKNAILLSNAEALHDGLDKLDLTTHDAHNIVSCSVGTLKTISKMYTGENTIFKKIFQDPKYRIVLDSGDGTVLEKSAGFLNVPPGNKYYLKGVAHSKMLSNDISRKLILEILAGKSGFAIPGVRADKNDCKVTGKLVSFPSNVDFSVTDLITGKKIIGGVGYSEKKVGNDKFIYLPTSDQSRYKILTTKKADAKPINLVINNYDNSKTTYYQNVNIDQALSLTLEPQASSDKLESVDQNEVAQVIPPSVEEELSLNEPTINPLIITKLEYKGTSYYNGQELTFENDRKINLIPNNLIRTVLTKYSYDQEIWQDYTGPHIQVPSYADAIYFFSADVSGQVEEVNVIYFREFSKNIIPSTPRVAGVSTSPPITEIGNGETLEIEPPLQDLSADPEGLPPADDISIPALSFPVQKVPGMENNLRVVFEFPGWPQVSPGPGDSESIPKETARPSYWSWLQEVFRFFARLIFF